MNVGALGCGDVDTHTGSAEEECSFEIALGYMRTYTKAYTVEHIFGIVRVAVCNNAKVGDLPALFLKVCNYCLLERITCKVRTYYKIFVLYCFHF
jgi:hypothetical protein